MQSEYNVKFLETAKDLDQFQDSTIVTDHNDTPAQINTSQNIFFINYQWKGSISMNVIVHLVFHLYITEEPWMYVSLITYDCQQMAQIEYVLPPRNTRNAVHQADNKGH